MDLVTDLAVDAAVVAAAMVLLWGVSVVKKDASIVDVFWGLGFTGLAWLSWARSERGLHATLLAAAVTLWGVRLALYIGVRNHGRGEDARYRRLREKYPPFSLTSLGIVFGLQGVLMLVVALPVELGMNGAAGAFDAVGGAIFVVGVVWESTADLQLALFKRRHPGALMDRGLFALSRHPNYFGEFVLWWGLGVMSLSSGTWWPALFGPATISFLLLRVSGVPMLEAAMRDRPGYAAYAASTPAFFPRFF